MFFITTIIYNLKQIFSFFKYFFDYNKNMKKLNLLKNILPYEFDDTFLENRKKYIRKNGCVLFTDVVSYCKMADTYSDMIIYMILNDMYCRFDKIIQKYSALCKIETIGDAYMAIGDIKIDENESKVQMIQFALELLDEIKNVHTPSHVLQLRIGLHFGSYIVCLLGKLKPRLCIVGKNVNLTARLQTTAEPNTIQISKSFYNSISNYDFRSAFEKNDSVFLKNIGDVETYTLRQRRHKRLPRTYSFSINDGSLSIP